MFQVVFDLVSLPQYFRCLLHLSLFNHFVNLQVRFSWLNEMEEHATDSEYNTRFFPLKSSSVSILVLLLLLGRKINCCATTGSSETQNRVEEKLVHFQ